MIISEEFDVTIRTNTGTKKEEHFNIVEFDNFQEMYNPRDPRWGKEIPSRYAWKKNRGHMMIYHLNAKGSFTPIAEFYLANDLIKYLADNV